MSNLETAIADYLSVCFLVWCTRWKRRLDIPLDEVARDVRWALAVGLFVLGLRVDIRLPLLRAALALASLAFASWPNNAYRVTNALRWAHLLPQPSPEYARTMRLYWGRPTDDDLEWDRQERQRAENTQRGRQK